MTSYKYTGDGHTLVQTVKGEEKVKVRHGEVVESDLEPRLFLTNNFRIVEEGTTEGNKVELSYNEIKEKLTELEVDFPKNAKKAVLEEILEKALAEKEGIGANSEGDENKVEGSTEENKVEVTTENDGKSDITVEVQNAEAGKSAE